MPDPLQDIKVQKEEPDTSLNPDIENVGVLTDNHDELRGQNPYYVKQKLLDDEDFFNKTAEKMFLSSYSSNEFNKLKDDPDKLTSKFEEYKKNFRKDLNEKSYAGETPDKSLVNRSVSMANDPSSVPTSDYIDIIQKNKKKYSDFFKEDGSLMYDADEPEFAQKIIQDNELHQKIESDRYNQFKEQLGKYQNTGDFFNKPEKLAKSWIVYDKLGKEGLTQYVNAYQGGEQSEEAQNYIKNVEIEGKSLDEYYQNFVTGQVKDVKFGDIISKYSYKNQLDPAVVSSVIQAESNFNPEAVSKDGAVGAMQIMPDTAKVDLGIDPENLTDPETNIKGGAKYLSTLMNRYDNNLKKALAAYNTGMGRVDKSIKSAKEKGGSWENYINEHGGDWNGETKPYIEKIQKLIPQYKKKTDRGLIFRDRKPREDLTKPFPKDLNNYMVNFYDKEGNLKEIDDVKNFVEKRFPKLKKKDWSIERFKKDGPYSEEYTDFTYSIYEKAAKKDGWGMQDLMKTLMANAKNGKTEEGRPYYEYNFNDLQPQQQWAHEALQFDSRYSDLFEKVGKNTYRLRPQRREAAAEDWKWLKDTLFATETKVVENAEGEKEFKTETKTDIFSQWRNTTQTLALGAASEALDMVNPIIDGLNKLSQATGVGEEQTRELSETVEQLTSINPSADLTTADEDGAFVSGVGEVAPMFWWMASMYGTGRAALKGATKAAQMATKGKSALDVMRLGKSMKGSPKFTAMANRLARGVKNKEPWATGMGVFYTGGAIREGVTDEDESFYNTVPELLGASKTNDVTELYNKSGDLTQTALDVGASLGIDLFADTAIGALRFGKDLGLEKFFKNKAPRSITWNTLRENYEVADKAMFKHDVREFWHNLTRDLANKPMGDIGESMAKDFTKGANVETVMDVGKMFSDNFGDIANNIKSEIRQNIDMVQRELGEGVRLSDQQIEAITNREYGRFVANTGEILDNVMKQSGDDGLSLRFAQALEQQVPTTKEFTVGGRQITPEEAAVWREKGYDITVKDGKSFVTDNRFWALDLARNIRTKALRDINPTSIIDRRLREANIDPHKYKNNEEAQKAQQIREETREAIGTPVAVNNKLGYIVDVQDRGYKVRTSDGDEVFTRVEDIPEEQLRQRARDSFNKRIRRVGETQQQAERNQLAGARYEVSTRIDRLAEKQQSLQNAQKGMKKLSDAEARIIANKQIDRFQGDVSSPRSLMLATEGATTPRTIEDLMGRNVRYGDYEGVLRRDAENNIVVDNPRQTVEVPTEKRANVPLEEVGIRQKVNHFPNSNVVQYNGNMYRYKDGLRSFEFDESGEAVTAKMMRQDGQEVTLKNKNLVDELYNSRVLSQDIDDPIRRRIYDQIDQKIENDNLDLYRNRLKLMADDKVKLANSNRRIPFC